MAEISGQIIAVLPTRSGTSAKGTAWSSQTAVIETREQYPKKVSFDVFGADRITQFNLQVGEYVTVSYDIDAHEYQGRWFNQIRAFNVAKSGRQTIQQPTPQPTDNVANTQAPQQAPQQQNMFNAGVQNATPTCDTPNTDDQLPF